MQKHFMINTRKMVFILLTLLICSFSFAQVQKDSFYHAKLKQPGVKMISVADGKHNVFTQKIGKGKIKLLLLHGGPGNGHEYFENFPEHMVKEGVTIYYYEQLGSYYSDSPLDSNLYTHAAFVEQVEDVRKALKLDNFYLLGHSWGGMLAQLYAQKYQKHLKGLILSHVPGYHFSPVDKAKAYSDSLTNLLLTKTMTAPAFSAYSPETMDSIRNGKPLADTALDKRLNKEFDRELYRMQGNMTYFNKGGTWPEPLTRNQQHTNGKPKNKYLAKFTNNHHRTDYKTALLSLQTKTLLLGSAQDYMYPAGYYDMQKVMTKAKVRVVITPNGSHFAMWDDTEHYFNALTAFIKDVQSGKF